MSAKCPIRGDDIWRAEMARRGAWDEPPPSWAFAGQRESPFTTDDRSRSLAALRRGFTRRRVRQIFRRPNPRSIADLLIDPFAAEHSVLFRLGLDLDQCEAWEARRLCAALLADKNSFDGARFETLVFAALERIGMPCCHEPLCSLVEKAGADGRSLRNPDLIWVDRAKIVGVCMSDAELDIVRRAIAKVDAVHPPTSRHFRRPS